MVKEILNTCKELGEQRPIVRSILKTQEEVGELSKEVNIHLGLINREPSVDGIVGEAIDTIISAIDTIYLYNPRITEEELLSTTLKKLTKWKNL